MAECPDCGFSNSELAVRCAACGRTLSGDDRAPSASGTREQPVSGAASGDALSGRQPDANGLEEDWLAQLLAATAEGEDHDGTVSPGLEGRPEAELPVWLRDLAPDDLPGYGPAVSPPGEGRGAEHILARDAAVQAAAAEGDAPADGVPAPGAPDLEAGDIVLAAPALAQVREAVVTTAETLDLSAMADQAVVEVGDGPEVILGSVSEAPPATEELPQVSAEAPGTEALAAAVDQVAVDVQGERPLLPREAAQAALELQGILAAEAVAAEMVVLLGSASGGAAVGEWDLTAPQPVGSTALEAAGRPPDSSIQGLPEVASSPTASDALAGRVRRLRDSEAGPARGRYLPDRVIPVGRSERLLRVLVPVVLVSVVVLAVVLPPGVRTMLPAVSLPSGYPVGPARMHDALRRLAAEDKVMVAFEYGPSQADEMDLVAVPVIQQLVAQGAQITIVSTRPDGLVAARTAVRSAYLDGLLSGHGVMTQDHVDGIIASGAYRPGDQVGVAHLLVGADDLDAVVVFASKPGPLRWWVELVRATPYSPPIVAGTSASVEGIAVAYLSSDPALLAGVVSGVGGAAFYERIATGSSDGRAAQRLYALSAGNLAIVLLVIVGAAVVGWPAPGARRGGRLR